MTSVPVTDIGINMPYVTDTGSASSGSGADFMGSLKTAIQSQSGNFGTGTNEVTDLTPSRKESDIEAVAKQQKSGMNDSKADLRKSTKSSEKKNAEAAKDAVGKDTAEKVNESAKKISEEVAKQMDVSPEEVEVAMESLGLSMTDLLNPENMADLITSLSGSDDTLLLLTDENLYSTLEKLQDFVKNIAESLMEELDLSQEAFDEVLVQTEELMEQPQMADVKSKTLDADLGLEGMKDFKTTITVNGEQITMDVTVDDSTGTQTVAYQNTGNGVSEDSQNKKNDHGNENLGDRESLFTSNLQINNTELPVTEVFTDEVLSYRTTPDEIANQILESMKANLKPEMTELEMNLHPASLGSVRVNLASQNGQISAQFVAQNETVKNALETQMIQLTRQLEDQGIKVEHVEVAIADYRFNQNAGNNGGQGGDKGSETAKAKVTRTRKIDLNAIDDMENLDELDDSDRITAQMMAHNGNTVDYTA